MPRIFAFPVCMVFVDGVAEGWQPIKAKPSHVALIRKVWHRGVATCRSMDAPYVDVPALEVREGGAVAAPTPYTTGLGLPLSRALAKAGGTLGHSVFRSIWRTLASCH